MINAVMLIGRVATDPELRYTTSGQPACRFRLAVDRPRRNGSERQADFFTVVAWGNAAESASRWLEKGRLVAVVGSLRTRQYEANGRNVRVVEVVGRVTFLDRPKAAGAGQEQASGASSVGAKVVAAKAKPQQQQAAGPEEFDLDADFPAGNNGEEYSDLPF